ncbi:MAG: DUF2268 domain-containing putative Zn-dependent protease [Acidobacteriota bacterium]
MRIAKIAFLLTAWFIFSASMDFASEQEPAPASKPNLDPDKAQFITSDIDNFWRAYDLAAKEPDFEKRKAIYQREYYDRGSQGVKDFIVLRLGKIENFVVTIEKHPQYYASIRQESLKVNFLKDQIRRSFKKLKALYPDAVFPDVYFMIGKLSTGGTTSKNGLLIGTEMYCRSKATPENELNDWLKAVLKPIATLPAIVAHELIHIQQDTPRADTLLAQSINEGAADFLGELIAGQIINPHLHSYGNPREKELWEDFRKEMNGKVYSKWLYNGTAAKDRPADLGYYMGYKICESYYKNARNKRQSIKDILLIKDFEQFFKASGYAEKFAGK